MRIRDYLLRIIAGALCIVLAAAIVTLVFMNQRRNRARAEELKTRQEEIKREEKEKLQKASDLYIDLATLCQDIRIVCWGDEEMRGQEELSLPKALEETANESLFTEVKDAFSGILDLDEQTPLDVETVNMGVSDEGMREILARAGVNELQVSQWTVIPADTEPKNISMRDDVSSTPLRFAEQRRDLFGPVTILDVEGSLVVGERASQPVREQRFGSRLRRSTWDTSRSSSSTAIRRTQRIPQALPNRSMLLWRTWRVWPIDIRRRAGTMW